MALLVSLLFGLYSLALQVSMAAMEFFSWALFLVFLIRFFRQKRPWQMLGTGAGLPLGIFFLALVISTIRSGVPVHEGWKMLGWARWILLFYGFTYLLRQFLTLKWENGHLVYLGVGILLSFYAFLQFQWGIELVHKITPLNQLGSHWRAEGFFNLCLTFAYMIGMVGLSALGLCLVYWRGGRKGVAIYAGSAYVLIWIGILTSLTRGAWFSYTVASVAVIVLFSKRWGAIIAGLGAACTAILVEVIKPLHARLLTVFDGTYLSNSLHQLMWKTNWLIFKDHPFFGVGLGQNTNVARLYYARLGAANVQFVSHAHNDILEFMACLGIFGAIAYVWFCAYFMKKAWDLYRRAGPNQLWYKAIGLGSLGAQLQFHLGGLTQCTFMAAADNHNLIFAWAITLAALSQVHGGPAAQPAEPKTGVSAGHPPSLAPP